MEKKVYNQIGLGRLLDIIVIKDDNKTHYESMVENAPNKVKQLKYSKIQTTDKVNFYVYGEFNEN